MKNAKTQSQVKIDSFKKEKKSARGAASRVGKVCGYIYEGDELPDDFVCPLCKHGAADFEPIK